MTTSSISRLFSILALSTSCLCATALSADPTPTAAPSATVAGSPPPATSVPTLRTIGYKDQFLGFVLTKAEKYSGKVEDAMGAAVDAAERELPTLCRQFLVWRMIDAALSIGVPFVIGIPFGFLFYTAFARWMAVFKDPTRFENGSRHCWTAAALATATRHFIFTLIGLVGAAISFGNVLANLDALKTVAEIYFAPHVYLMEQAVALLHKG